jgi:hypothetical protein
MLSLLLLGCCCWAAGHLWRLEHCAAPLSRELRVAFTQDAKHAVCTQQQQ